MNITFNTLPMAVGQLHEKLIDIEKLILANSGIDATKLLTPINSEQLCSHLNISMPTCIRWRKKGRIPFLKIGASIRYNLPEVINALENHKREK